MSKVLFKCKGWLILFLITTNLNIIGSQIDNVNFDNISVEDGLSHNHIHCIFQDSIGWIWFGTALGINRFDGYRFKDYPLYKNDSTILNGLIVRTFYQTKKGELLVGFEDHGLGIYDRKRDVFKSYTLKEGHFLSENSVKDIVEGEEGNLWLATKLGLNRIDNQTKEVKSYLLEEQNPNALNQNYIRQLGLAVDGKLWIGTRKGLVIFNPENETFRNLENLRPGLNDEIWEIRIDGTQAWIGTYNSGIFIFDVISLDCENLIPDKSNSRSRTVRSIMKDSKQRWWIGTRGGLYVYNNENKTTRFFGNNALDNNSLVHNSILDIIEDKKGDVWIGTRGGVSLIIDEKQAFRHFKAIPNDNRYLNSNEIYCFWVDEKERLWVGTENGGINILDRNSNRFEYITTDGIEGRRLSSNCIKAITPDGLGNILIGTFQGGMNVYNPASGKITHCKHNPDDPGSISGNMVWSIVGDKSGNLWVATENGLDLYNPETRTFVRQKVLGKNQLVAWICVDSDNHLWVGANELYILDESQKLINRFNEKGRNYYKDHRGRIWITTEDSGLVLYDKYKGPLKYYTEKSGLASDRTYCVQEDDNGMLWVSTANGLSKFDPENEIFENYTKSDGLQSNQFVYGAGYKLSSGELLFGGTNGFNIFHPSEISKNDYKPPVVITDFKIFNQPVEIGDGKSAVLKNSIMETDYLEIPYKYNVLTFEFAALNYAKSEKNEYRYIMEGFDKDWNKSELRTATYTNLNPGEYVFRVIGSNGDNAWNNDGDYIKIKILPPYYKTWWFRTLVVFTFILLVTILFLFFVNRKNLQNALVFEKEKAKKLHELDMMKFRFFTNISHEIKTPLTLIISPLEKMLQYHLSASEARELLEVMHRNAKQLLKLITQLLDYRKLEAGKLKIEYRKGNIVPFVQNICNSFSGVIFEKKISFKFKSVQKEIQAFFDSDKLEKILNNLLSNAIKYTPEKGQIAVFLSVVIDDGRDYGEREEKYIKIVVRDSGIGIAESDLNKVFTRFFRTGSEDNVGSGIGLAFTKELVTIHGGQIFAESKQGKGSSFTVLLPYIESIEIQSIHGNEKQMPLLDNRHDENDTALDKNKKILLVIEDNTDVRQFIRSHFEKEFNVAEANEGKQGIDEAVRLVPDIVISDIMMPGISGTELCEKLKKDERTSHIPIILLSALSSKENVMDGLLKGADDYITKPFDITMLQTKVENLMNIRKSLREKYSNELVLQPKSIKITSPDERFLQKAIRIIEKYIDDPDLDIEKFTSQIGISRMQLYRKLAALTGMTVKEFINDIRLKRASELILQKNLSVSEVAYAVGFSDISYFGKCFRKKFGMSATEYVKTLDGSLKGNA